MLGVAFFFQPHHSFSSRLPSQDSYNLNIWQQVSDSLQSRATLHRFTLHSASCPALPPMDASRGSSNIFPMPQIPTLLLASPPPAAMALPSSSLSLSSYSSSSSLRGHANAPSITSFPILLLTVLGILAASVILLAYYVFVIRCCLTWHRHRGSSSSSGVAGLIVSRRPQRTRSNTSASIPADDDAEPPRGLEDAAIRALPAFSYRKKKPANAAAEPSAPASECAVCLGEFEEGDTVRMLPACLHVFHLGCVDAWLQGNTSCPLCRADVAATLCRLLPPPLEEEVVAIQVVVVPGGAEEGGHETLTTLAQQRAATVAPAADIEGEDTYIDRLVVGGDKTKTSVDGMTERRKDGEVVPPRTSED